MMAARVLTAAPCADDFVRLNFVHIVRVSPFISQFSGFAVRRRRSRPWKTRSML